MSLSRLIKEFDGRVLEITKKPIPKRINLKKYKELYGANKNSATNRCDKERSKVSGTHRELFHREAISSFGNGKSKGGPEMGKPSKRMRHSAESNTGHDKQGQWEVRHKTSDKQESLFV